MKTVAVLMGGRSAEREVSLASGKACAEALRQAGYDVREADVNGGGVDQLPSLAAFGIAKRAAARTDPQRLARFALGLDIEQTLAHGRRIVRRALEGGAHDYVIGIQI